MSDSPQNPPAVASNKELTKEVLELIAKAAAAHYAASPNAMIKYILSQTKKNEPAPEAGSMPHP